MKKDPVKLSELEKDDRIVEIQRYFPDALRQESGYTKLNTDEKAKVEAALIHLEGTRFENIATFESIAKNILQPVANYIDIAINNAKDQLSDQQGVLVIYAGGTIGSAPKDMDDPDSPQAVKSWTELKNASPQLGGLGYPVDAISFVEPLDSCNVGPEHWNAMSSVIKKYYDHYAGFVVLHGTDTMTFTSSALSFVLQELTKPVVVTGSQVAGIVNPRNDAHQNMITAVMLANAKAHKLAVIPEVIIAFGNRILRGCRSKKMNVTNYQGFDSPSYPRLGDCGDHVVIDLKQVKAPSNLPLSVYSEMNTNVIIVEVFPGMQNTDILKNILSMKSLKGVVLKAYGAGNIPTDVSFLNLFKDFVDKGGVVVVVTSVPTGHVDLGLYETSQVLVDRGLISGFDLTPEAALCKLMMLLGSYPNDVQQVKTLMQQSLVGEQRLSLELTQLSGAKELSVGKKIELQASNLASTEEGAEKIETVLLYFKDVELKCSDNAKKSSINLMLDNQIDLGTFSRENVPSKELVNDDTCGESLAFNLTEYKEHFIGQQSTGRMGGGKSVNISISLDGESSHMKWSEVELKIYVQD